jgi:hypothetical protein
MAEALKLPEGAVEIDPIVRPTGPALPSGAEEPADLTKLAQPSYPSEVASEAVQGVSRVAGGLGRAAVNLPGELSQSITSTLIPPGARPAGEPPTNEVGGGLLEAGLGAAQAYNAWATPIQNRVGAYVTSLVKGTKAEKLIESIPGAQPGVAERVGNVANIGTGVVLGALGTKALTKGMEWTGKKFTINKPLQEVVSQGTTAVTNTLPIGDYSLRRAGGLFKRKYAAEMTAVKNQVDDLYKQARSVVPDTDLITPTPLQNAVQGIAKTLESRKGVLPSKAETLAGKLTPKAKQAPGTAGGTPLTSFSQDVIDQITAKYGLANPQKQWSYQGLASLQDEVQSLRNQAFRSGADDVAHQLKSIEGGIEDSIKIFEAKYPALKTLRANADDYYKRAYAPYFKDGAFAREAANKNPEEVVKYIIKDNKYSQVQSVKNMIVEQGSRKGIEDWQKVSKAWWTDMVQNSMEANGQFNAAKLVSQLKGYSPEVRNVVLGPRVARKGGPLDELISNVEIIEQTRPGIFTAKVGPVGMGYGVVRVMGATLAGRPAEAMLRGGSLLVTPMLLSKLLSTEHGLKLLNDGFKVAPGTKAAMHIAAQLANLVSSTERIAGREEAQP